MEHLYLKISVVKPDPTKPKAVLNELKSIKMNVGSIQDKFNQFNVTDLQKQINDLQENLKIMTLTQPSTQYDSINTIHNDILKSINFELQKQARYPSRVCYFP